MNLRDWVRLQQSDPDAILNDLSNRQYLRPHQTLREALDAAGSALAFCPLAAESAVEWLGLDATRLIGRVERTELIQLSRSIHRFWRQALTEQTSHLEQA